MTPDRFKELLDRYARGQCSEAEKKLVDEWYETLGSGGPTSIPSGTEEKLWNRINATNARENARNRSFNILKIAASVSVIAVVSVWLYLNFFVSRPIPREVAIDIPLSPLAPGEVNQEIRNDSNTPRIVTLEDGSVITLQPESKLTLPTKFAPSERVVGLTGEAFFDIERDTLRPFFVYSREVVTKVLGTSFTITARESDKQITVAVKTGKVSVFTNRVKNKQSSEVILTPNQQAVYDRSEIVVTKELVEKPQVILEKPTIFMMKYNETPVSEIFAALEKNYGVQIEYNESVLRNCVLTTTMSEEGLFERIQVICKAIGATYSVDNAVIKIDGKRCQ